MSRLEVWLLHLSTIILTLTGLAYAGMHYMLKPADPFSVVNNPLEPHMVAIHIMVAPLLIIAVGMILHSHILWKLSNGVQTARRSGVLLLPLFVVMVVSGYFLQIMTASWRPVIVIIHLGSGILWFTGYVGHQLASLRFRRSMQEQDHQHSEALRISE